jgi:peroxiredoxin
MTIATGSPSPAFSLPNATDDRILSLQEGLSTGPVIVALYKSSCRASKLALPVLQQLYGAYPADRIAIWGLALDSANITASFARRYAVSLPLLIDDEGYPTGQAYGITETPTIFLIESPGVVSWQLTGFDKVALDQLNQEIARRLELPATDLSAAMDDLPAHLHG